MILSIDTTAELGSIAITEANVVIEEVALHAPEGFGHVLFSHIEHLLERNGTTVHQMECFAAASGPGSFTGVRVGLAAAKGLAEATGKRVVAVSNLRALASFGTAPLRAVVIDARRGEVYAAVYNSDLEIVMPEVVIAQDRWLAGLPEGCDLISTIEKPRALAAAVGHIAWDEFTLGRASDPAEIDANYVRRSDAELFWKD
ncbi:MAG TPA: tRNA (adenosine(37)-N6)-threonylcarbamoyltransferase complex dimerization subunit type 1 TsaB [Bryobacteraceae bacterium]|nr:tRNA (adenosine(37)-N6)-threonylcarbamoyltransferase complex dimerization subunit type 1 TsaB [Bryobacteraceae bacterium]